MYSLISCKYLENQQFSGPVRRTCLILSLFEQLLQKTELLRLDEISDISISQGIWGSTSKSLHVLMEISQNYLCESNLYLFILILHKIPVN